LFVERKQYLHNFKHKNATLHILMNLFIRSPGGGVGQAPRSWLACREQHALCRGSSLGGRVEIGTWNQVFPSLTILPIALLQGRIPQFLVQLLQAQPPASNAYLAEAVRCHSNCTVYTR